MTMNALFNTYIKFFDEVLDSKNSVFDHIEIFDFGLVKYLIAIFISQKNRCLCRN